MQLCMDGPETASRESAPDAARDSLEVLGERADGTLQLRIKGDAAGWVVDALAAAATAVITSGVEAEDCVASGADSPLGSAGNLASQTPTGRASAQMAGVGRCSPRRGLYAWSFPVVPHRLGAAAGASAIRVAAELAAADPTNIVAPAAVVLLKEDVPDHLIEQLPQVPRDGEDGSAARAGGRSDGGRAPDGSESSNSEKHANSLAGPPRVMLILPSLPLPAGMVGLTLREWLAVPTRRALSASSRAILESLCGSGPAACQASA